MEAFPPTLASSLSVSTPGVTPSTASSFGTSVDGLTNIKWQVQYGFWSDLDVLYNAHPSPQKPRIPDEKLDEAHEWSKRMIPKSIDEFLGNSSAAQCLRYLDSGDANLFTNFIVSGGDCTGKASFVGLLKHTLAGIDADHAISWGTLNAKQLGEKDLLTKIEEFTRRVDLHKVKAAYLIIERFEAVASSTQQHSLLPMLDAANAKNVFLIVHVRPDVTKLAERFKQRAVKVHLQSLPPMLVRTKLLLICLQERIGFSRDGIEELLQICDSKLLPCMEKLHVMFLAQHFISLPNVQKSLSPKRQTTNAPVVPPFQLMILAMNAPLRRCPKCTLIPPCSHISIGMLYDKVQRIRKLYPNQKATDTSSPSSPAVKAAPPSESPLVCPSFLQSGMCRNIQSLGRCRYLHPLDLHTIDTSAIVKRCGVHTLSLPCMHCANLKLLSQALRDEDAKCTQLETQVHALRKKFANVEIQNVLFVRDNAKTMKWGTQKREYDTKLAHIDAQLTRLRKEIDEVSTDLATSHATREQLERDVQCGKSRGTLAQQRRHQHEASSTTTSVITSS